MSTASISLDELLKLPARERADIAHALWESLTETEQEAEFVLTDELKVELDRLAAEHEADPHSAIPWEEVRKKLRNKR